MAFAFDTLGYAKHLESSGVDRKQAEAHAEAARQFIMTELVTKTDLQQALDHQALQLTVRLGGLIAAGIAVLGVLLRLTGH